MEATHIMSDPRIRKLGTLNEDDGYVLSIFTRNLILIQYRIFDC